MHINLCTVLTSKPDFQFIFGFPEIFVLVSRNIRANARVGGEVGRESEVFWSAPLGEADQLES